MLKLRLKRMGAPKRPFYRIIAIDDSARRQGAYIEKLGTYDPRKEKDGVVLDEEKVMAYLHKGAEPTETVRSILSRMGLWSKYKATAKKAKQ